MGAYIFGKSSLGPTLKENQNKNKNSTGGTHTVKLDTLKVQKTIINKRKKKKEKTWEYLLCVFR